MSTAARTAIAAGTALLLFPVLLIAAAAGAISGLVGGGGDSGPPSQTAIADIPTDYLTLYQQATAVCPGLNWTVLAAIGKIESDHGRSTLPGVHNGQNQAGAGGPLQLLQPTWNDILTHHHIPPGGASPPSRYNPHDAIYAAAYYLCDNGAAHDINAAVFAYNHSHQYVTDVLAQAAPYTDPTMTGSVACDTVPLPADELGTEPTDAAAVAVGFACEQLGKPYVWGGNGNPGFDCSGLTHAAYTAAGINIPRTAQTQYNTGPLLPPGTPLQPGDLVFFGTPDRIHHVGISLGGTLMIDAPDVGQTVKIEDLRTFPDYAAASRPPGTTSPEVTVAGG
jgi:cell wall-associated NlpC family hydrolase